MLVEAITFLPERQQTLFLNPTVQLQKDLEDIYKNNQYEVGWPMGARRVYADLARPHTEAVVRKRRLISILRLRGVC